MGDMEPELTTLCNQTCVYHNCYQRGFIQQLMEADSETHRKSLGRAWRILLNGVKKDGWSQRGQDTTRKQFTESTNQRSYGLTETELTTMEPVWV
ncbi:hypothetical protein STEG23_009954 [Scotinomys teguina]